MTVWAVVEPLTIDFNVDLAHSYYRHQNTSNPSGSQELSPLSQADLMTQVKGLIGHQKLPIPQVAAQLCVSTTTVRRICRTLKIGPYRELKSGAIRPRSSQTPFGWVLDQGELRRNADEWRWVTAIHRMRADGRSLHQIAAYLHSKKVTTKNGGQWHAKTVSQILKFNAPYLDRAS